MGYFITVEGGEGCGKTSVLSEVVKRLIDDGFTNIVSSTYSRKGFART